MIKSLTALRGIFILFIFLHHAGVYPGGGAMGVVFFFVLSGFSMTLGYHDRVITKEFCYKQYLIRRAIKFYPMHWITLLANIPLTLMTILNWWLIPLFFINAALLQTIVPVQKIYFSYNAVSWFLADILFFAVVFPFIFRKIVAMSRMRRVILMLVGFVLYNIIFFISYHLPEGVMKGIVYISPFVRLFDFVFGILLGLDFLSIKNKPIIYVFAKQERAISFGIIAIILMLIIESFILSEKFTLIAPLYWPLTAVLIMLAVLPDKLKLLENKFLLRLGECSFTIFLVHRLVLRYTSKLLGINNKIIFVLFCLVLTIILSLLIERHILNPVTQWLTKKNQPSMTVRS